MDFQIFTKTSCQKGKHRDKKARRMGLRKRRKRQHCLVCTINNKNDGRECGNYQHSRCMRLAPASIYTHLFMYYIFNAVKLLNTSRILTARVLKIVHLSFWFNPAIKLKIGKVKRIKRKKVCSSYMYMYMCWKQTQTELEPEKETKRERETEW